MSNGSEQNFSNHAKTPTSLIAVTLLLVVGGLTAAIGVIRHAHPSGVIFVGFGAGLVSLGTIAGLLIARTYATGLQDRIIRTEMQLRLAKVLPSAQQDLIPQLNLPQLIALRFASDEELPSLTRKVIDENIADRKTIKKLIIKWQADNHRI